MVWKIIYTADDRLVKAGFSSREDAEEWLDQRLDIDPDDCDITEMDEDEEEEYLENQADGEDDPEGGSFDYDRAGRGDYASRHVVDDKIADGDDGDMDLLGEIFEGDDDDMDDDRSGDEESEEEDEEDL